MSDSSIPPYIDTRKVFQHEGKLIGELSLDRLPRFKECLASEVGTVNIALSFDLNESKRRVISGHLTAAVEVICQRCLEPTAIALADDIKLAIVKDEADAKGLESELDPWITEEYKLDIAPLIEEQLILCMPLVSYHQDGDCMAKKHYVASEQIAKSETQSERARRNPFSVLESLKKRDKTD